ncbi:hypothetical protein PUN28_000601 [Cardiocondyla obscurior]|uniref:Uncharacterized protein n=1 Tax=Cardiocondyla obscurior TaxID=286306 RepID=A0AAW2H098_9HYME
MYTLRAKPAAQTLSSQYTSDCNQKCCSPATSAHLHASWNRDRAPTTFRRERKQVSAIAKESLNYKRIRSSMRERRDRDNGRSTKLRPFVRRDGVKRGELVTCARRS